MGWPMMLSCNCARILNFRATHYIWTIFTQVHVALFEDLAKLGIAATGTLRIDRKGVPDIVKQLQKALSERNVPCGHGYYIPTGSLVYVCWRDKRTVTAMSVVLPGHGAEFVERRVKGNRR